MTRSLAWLVRAIVVLSVLGALAGVALAQLPGTPAVPSHEGFDHLSVAGFVLIAGVVLVLLLRSAAASAPGDGRPRPQARAWMNTDVSAVRLGIEARSREFMQAELRKLAVRGNARPVELVESLRAVVRLLRKCDTAWVYGGASNYHPMSAPIAEGVFRRHAQDARSKYGDKIIRHASGIQAVRTGSEPRAVGPNVAMMTLVVAARREIRDFFGGRREEIHAVLDDLEKLTPEEIVAIEVVWTPESPDDRMTAGTLQALEPDLVKLPGRPGKTGRPTKAAHCAYCRGPFSAELPTCPHCGAPAPGEEAEEDPARAAG